LTDSQSIFHISSTSYGGGGETHIRFSNNNYDYIVYEKNVRSNYLSDGTRPMSQESGLVIKKNGIQISRKKCDDSTDAGIHRLAYHIMGKEEFMTLK
jgi:hypothetical protein